jgi:hypothetical protein
MTKDDIATEAKRAGFRAVGDTFLRLTDERCVMDSDMVFLHPIVQHVLHTPSGAKVKWFHPVDIDDKPYFIDVITGTSYSAVTGASNSPGLFIDVGVNVPKKKKTNKP